MKRTRILLVSRFESVASLLESRLSGYTDYKVTTRVLTNGSVDPLHDVSSRPDVLLLHHTPGSGELEYLTEHNITANMPLVVFGAADDPEAMRLAMRAGASDYLIEPLLVSDLVATLDRVREDLEKTPERLGKLVTVVNSKGGSGASFLATNLACAISRRDATRLILMDLDLQFGGLAKYLDLEPERGLLEALGEIDAMDETASEAYITRHKSGLRLLAAPSDHLALAKDIPSERVDALLHLFLADNDFVVADIPRRIGTLSATVMERSDQIVLVVQQSLAHIHDAARMIQLLTDELAIGRERILTVVNRHTKNAIIELDDIRRTLKTDQIATIPNNYKLVAESIDSGTPVSETARNSTVAKAISEIQNLICGTSEKAIHSTSFLRRALPGLLGGN